MLMCLPHTVGRRDSVPLRIKAQDACDPATGPAPTTFNHWPPGVKPRHPDVEGAVLKAGLRIPLIAQGQPVGAMIVHTTSHSHFHPGAIALMQTFANQAAIAIQRAGLIENLQEKITQLEAAQDGLAQKERMVRELELAREVQQAVLPHTFPEIPGYHFAAHNQPARQVGGDFYDVIDLGAGRFGLVVADVSDKGMPAAVYMALTRSLMVAEARREIITCGCAAKCERIAARARPGAHVCDRFLWCCRLHLSKADLCPCWA